MASKENQSQVNSEMMEMFGVIKIDNSQDSEIRETKSEREVGNMENMFQDLDQEQTEKIRSCDK